MDIIDGYKVHMDSTDVMCEFDIATHNGDDDLGRGQYWCCTVFGPVVDNEVFLTESLYEAFEWIRSSIYTSIVDEVGFWCWKDRNEGTEWEIRKVYKPERK